MKATLEYTLPEEAEEHMSAMRGSLWKSLVFEYDQALRSKLKYGNPGDDGPGLQVARDLLWDALKDADLSLD